MIALAVRPERFRKEVQGGHIALVEQELGDDADDEHAQEVERLDAGHVASTQVRTHFIHLNHLKKIIG